ncbi:hypothetical protein [Sporomusa sp.]|uniref:hypothetical protein n=1 Tax=Sporomusa sp. TaxID=2078658 RepID=UPI002C67C642|nr:hypothetical protein [Sporomusa sp.]HWR41667.1 hypothetical protein [Sporomusa sp.]
MGDGETPDVAEERALVHAKRAAIEQSGSYLESYTEVVGQKLTKDEIRVISAGLVKVEVVEKTISIQEKGGINFGVKIKAVVNTDNMMSMVSRMRDRSMTDKYNEVQQKYDSLQKEHLSDLNSQQVEKRVNNEKQWLSNYWLDTGMAHYLRKEYDEAILAAKKSNMLNRNNSTFAAQIWQVSLDIAG